MNSAELDFDRLLKLRLVVARYGEMDIAKWWNTRGQLGRHGTAATRRGFPRTHYFAQARCVFAVAASRCREVFDPPHSVTLWQLSEAVEEEFETHWERWLDSADAWEPFFAELGPVDKPRPDADASEQDESHEAGGEHLTARGAMDPRLLCESPFTDIDPLGVAGLFKEGEVVELIQILHDVQERAAA